MSRVDEAEMAEELGSGQPEATLADRRRREAELIYGSEEEVSGAMAKDWLKLTERPDYYSITKMTAGVRDPNRVNIFLDGHFAFSLDVTQTVDFGLKVGQHISPKKLEKLTGNAQKRRKNPWRRLRTILCSWCLIDW